MHPPRLLRLPVTGLSCEGRSGTIKAERFGGFLTSSLMGEWRYLKRLLGAVLLATTLAPALACVGGGHVRLTQEVQVSRLIRVRYGDIKLEKSIPRGGWMELPLDKVNYLRQMVGLSPETRSKVLVDDPRSQFKQVAQIRRAVRKHRERQHTENRQAHPEREGYQPIAPARPTTKKPTRSQAQRTRLGASESRSPRPAPRKP